MPVHVVFTPCAIFSNVIIGRILTSEREKAKAPIK
jgi:hypothetical protein